MSTGWDLVMSRDETSTLMSLFIGSFNPRSKPSEIRKKAKRREKKKNKIRIQNKRTRARLEYSYPFTYNRELYKMSK